MAPVKFANIALLGATGNVGSRILKSLVKDGFAVTALQRPESKSAIPAHAKGIKVDFSSREELSKAFQGQDAVVSALPNPTLSSDRTWMNAAIDAGVKRIVPSEFSTNLETESSQRLPIVKDKIEIRKHVESLAASGAIEWTSVNNGPFLMARTWTSGFIGPSLKSKTTMYHDGGNCTVGTTTLERIGEAVAKVLSDEHSAATKNQATYVYSALMSERRMTELVAKASGTQVTDFEVVNADTDTILKDAYAAEEKGDMSKHFSFYIPFMFGKGFGGDYKSIAWNDKLGLSALTEPELEALVKSWL